MDEVTPNEFSKELRSWAEKSPQEIEAAIKKVLSRLIYSEGNKKIESIECDAETAAFFGHFIDMQRLGWEGWNVLRESGSGNFYKNGPRTKKEFYKELENIRLWIRIHT